MGYNRDQIVDMYQTRMRSLTTSIRRDQEEQEAIAYNAAMAKRQKDAEFYAKMQLGLGVAGMVKDLRESFIDRRMGETYGDPLDAGEAGILPKKYEFKKGFHPFKPLKETEGFKEFQRDIPNKQILDKIKAGVDTKDPKTGEPIYTQEQYEQAKINAKNNSDKFNADYQAGAFESLVSTEEEKAALALKRQNIPVAGDERDQEDWFTADEGDVRAGMYVDGEWVGSAAEPTDGEDVESIVERKNVIMGDEGEEYKIAKDDPFKMVKHDPLEKEPFKPEFSEEQTLEIQEGRNKAYYDQWQAKQVEQDVHPEKIWEYDQWKEEVEAGGIPGIEMYEGTVHIQPERPDVPVASEDEVFDEEIIVDEDPGFREFAEWEQPDPPPSDKASIISPIEAKMEARRTGAEVPIVPDALEIPEGSALKGQEWRGLKKGYQPKTTGLKFQAGELSQRQELLEAKTRVPTVEGAQDVTQLQREELIPDPEVEEKITELTQAADTKAADLLEAKTRVPALEGTQLEKQFQDLMPSVPDADLDTTALVPEKVDIPDAKPLSTITEGLGTISDISTLTSGGSSTEAGVKKAEIASKLGAKALVAKGGEEVLEEGAGKMLSKAGKFLGAGLGIFTGLKTAFDEDATDVQRAGGGMQALGSGLLATGIGAPIGALLAGVGTLMNLFGGGSKAPAPIPASQRRKISSDLGKYYRARGRRRGIY